MLDNVFGRKVGMTQIFDGGRSVVPVTVINVNYWFVTQIKSQEKDGYKALQIGLLKKRYRRLDFRKEWLEKRSDYFQCFREVHLSQDDEGSYIAGDPITLNKTSFETDAKLAIAGKSCGLGFQGVVKRWNFSGGPSAHGSRFHRRPGSIGNFRTQGEVNKGKALPGRTGGRRTHIKGVRLIRLDKENGFLLVKGAVPGKKNSLLSIHRQG